MTLVDHARLICHLLHRCADVLMTLAHECFYANQNQQTRENAEDSGTRTQRSDRTGTRNTTQEPETTIYERYKNRSMPNVQETTKHTGPKTYMKKAELPESGSERKDTQDESN